MVKAGLELRAFVEAESRELSDERLVWLDPLTSHLFLSAFFLFLPATPQRLPAEGGGWFKTYESLLREWNGGG